MKHTAYNKPVSKGLLFPACLWLMLFFIAAASAAFSAVKEKYQKGDVNQIFRQIEKKMETAYNNGNLKNVIDIYNEKCSKGEEGKPGKEKKLFKKVNKETRADIYRWMFLSYSALDRPEKADIFLKKYLVIRRGEGVGKTWKFLEDRVRNRYYVAPQWLVGLKLGVNFTAAHPYERFDILVPTPGTQGDPYSKDYVFDFKHSRGTELGFILQYNLTKRFSLNLQPTLSTIKFQYKNKIEWKEEYSKDAAAIFTHNQSLNYVELLVLLKYQLMNVKSSVKIYLQVGGFYSTLRSAKKSIDFRFEQGNFDTEKTMEVLNLKEQFTRSNIGFVVGTSCGFDAGKVRLLIELNYKHTLNIITDEENRFHNDLIFGYYDVLDDIKVRNWELSLKVLLPVTFKAFKR